ncbi:hypothetical protein ACRRTK_009326 [Alexandromys fortis]
MEEFKAFLTTLCSPFCTAMCHVELLPASPCILLLSNFSWAGLPIFHQQLQYPKLCSPAGPQQKEWKLEGSFWAVF